MVVVLLVVVIDRSVADMVFVETVAEAPVDAVVVYLDSADILDYR